MAETGGAGTAGGAGGGVAGRASGWVGDGGLAAHVGAIGDGGLAADGGPVGDGGLASYGGLAGEPDGFERLWTPHRAVYVGGEARPADGRAEVCPFCRAPGRDDEDSLIVARGRTVYALLNLFPYNPGHLLICPYRHVPGLTDLDQDEAGELMDFTRRAVRAIRRAKTPQGFNLGMNLGAVAGAGISAHLHQHVVPRWTGDSNFFPVVARSRAMPELLAVTRAAIAAAWSDDAGG
ncbi:MAG: HIT domain-containing protein [Bifidobacteriaceae bacterium]|jgi:ATP adenylyltransferase|nr:HIT domain-containing protein [Bifidobacteriaceae bacterium]